MLERRWLSNDGPYVREFESQIAERLGVKHVVATSNGTLALELLIQCLGLHGEVIVPSFTFVATVHSLVRSGVQPVFADIDPTTHSLDPASVRRAITHETSAILPVHLWGKPAAVEEIAQIAEESNLDLIFDAAHAFGVRQGNRAVGSFGRAEVFSFHATKFFNSFEGGAVATNDDELAAKLRTARNFGFSGEDSVVALGTNAKMTEICAAMGLVNLDSLEEFIVANRANYFAYREQLSDLGGISIFEVESPNSTLNYQYVVALVDGGRRDSVLARLREENVLARRYFWPGVHRMEPYRTLQPHAGATLPTTEQVASQVLVLPTGSAVSIDDVAQISTIIKEFVANG
jgi:dTDP-4-amino-4,6-dideoxygalactose transaminase